MNIIIIHEVGYLSKPVYEYQDFAERLAHLGHSITVIDFDEGVKGPLVYQKVSKTGLADVTLITLPNIGLSVLGILNARYQFGLELKKLFSAKKPDVVFLYSVFVNGVTAVKVCRAMGIPVVYRAIDAYHRLRKSRWQSWLLRQGESFIYQHVNLLTVTNRKMEEYVHQIGGARCSPTVILDHGVDTEHFQRLGCDQALMRKLGIELQDIVLVFLGTTYEFSQLDLLIKRIPQVCKEMPNLKLMIIGAGELDQSIQAKIKEFGLQGRVICCGMIDYSELPKYLSLAKLALLPFQINGITRDIIPIKILQYLSSSLPVVSTPLPDVVTHFPSQVSGIVYSRSDDVDALMSAIQSTMRDNLDGLSLSARQFVCANYSMRAATSRLEKILSL